MLKTVESFEQEMQKANLKYHGLRDLEDGRTVCICGVSGLNTRYDVTVIFDADERHIALRVFQLLKVPIDRMGQILELMNALNHQFRWIKFTVDQDNDVSLQADAIVDSHTCGTVSVELLVRIMKIIDEAYPQFMKVIWAG